MPQIIASTTDTRRTALVRRSVFLDLVLLAKPELTGLSVVTAFGASCLASPSAPSFMPLLTTFVGTILIGSACGALNEWMEREYDALMRRTQERPLPSGRMQPRVALIAGIVSGLLGLGVLAAYGSYVATGLGLITLVSYLLVYTPLKRRTPFATVVGGIPGALPPLIGWAVVRGGLDIEAWALFFVLFFWQMPHFLALGWMYRKDYQRAEFPLLVVVDADGNVVARQALIYACALVIAGIMPTLVGLCGTLYFITSLPATVAFAWIAVRFQRDRSNTNARRLFFASLVVLPVLFGLMITERLVH